MKLTSLNRMLISAAENDPLGTEQKYKRRYAKRISAISARIETYLDRDLELTTHTEYFDVSQDQLSFFVKAYPITAITSVESDSTGEFTGNESAETDYYIGESESSVVLDSVVTPARRGLKIVYTGGLATHAVNSVYEITAGTGTLTVDRYAQGATSGAVGRIVSLSGTTLTLEVLYGEFEAGETIAEKTTEAGSTSTTDATIDSVTTQCLAEAYPDIVEATELQIQYMDRHRSDYENASTVKGQTSRSSLDSMSTDGLMDEVRHILMPYQRITVG